MKYVPLLLKSSTKDLGFREAPLQNRIKPMINIVPVFKNGVVAPPMLSAFGKKVFINAVNIMGIINVPPGTHFIKPIILMIDLFADICFNPFFSSLALLKQAKILFLI